MIEAPHYSAAGAKKKAVRLPAALFDGTVNEHALHRAVVTYLANQRQGTHDTKTRSEVSGGNQKPWRQKGTGRAPRAPLAARRDRVRAPSARLPAGHPEEAPSAREEVGAQRAGARRRAVRGGRARVREAQDQDARRAAGEAGCGGAEGARPDGGRRPCAQRVPLGPQYPEGARDAVRGRDRVRAPVVRRGGGRAARAGRGAREGGRGGGGGGGGGGRECLSCTARS